MSNRKQSVLKENDLETYINSLVGYESEDGYSSDDDRDPDFLPRRLSNSSVESLIRAEELEEDLVGFSLNEQAESLNTEQSECNLSLPFTDTVPETSPLYIAESLVTEQQQYDLPNSSTNNLIIEQPEQVQRENENPEKRVNMKTRNICKKSKNSSIEKKIKMNKRSVARKTGPKSKKEGTSKKQKKVLLTWESKNLIANENQLTFLGDSSLPSTIRNQETPFQFFSLFFTEDMIKHIAEQSNLYAIQKNVNKPLNLTIGELRSFFGILIYTSIFHYPSLRSYWCRQNGFLPIIQTMTVNRFEEIKRFLHINDNTTMLSSEHLQHDRLHKIRYLIENLNINFSKISMPQRLSIDEQICATKIKHFMKQYNPRKPHKWGFKLLVLCSTEGFAHKFEVYSGQENDATRRFNNEPDLGASANIVVRLARDVPRNKGHILFFDNYYTSIPLVAYLAKEGIQSLGTVRRNRLPDCTLPNQEDLKVCPRGTSKELVTTYQDVTIASTIWKDNKAVLLLSSYAGIEPKLLSCRYDKKLNKEIAISCPYIVQEYNIHMGGVDLMDSHLGRNRIQLKSRKWWMRLFFHLLDVTIVNSWLIYRRVHKDAEKLSLTQSLYRAELASTLCNIGHATLNKRGRPPSYSLENEIQAKKCKGRPTRAPTRDVRLDSVAHWPEYTHHQGRCSLPSCTGISRMQCKKCNVKLCLTNKKNCFYVYHNN